MASADSMRNQSGSGGSSVSGKRRTKPSSPQRVSTSGPPEARMRALTDPHSPAQWRVNGPLSNLTEFAQAFQCKPGDPMVRAERCDIW